MGFGESNGSLGRADGMRARLGRIMAGQASRSSKSMSMRPHAPDTPQIPDLELLRCIGHGSYGEVWLARNILASYRAVKIVDRKAFRDEEAFETEFSGLRRFEPVSREHEGFVAILHVGRNRAGGFFYYVMELADDDSNGNRIDPDRYVPKTLSSELARRGRLSIRHSAQLGFSLSEALAELHRHGLVHRDIKPSNIIFVKGRAKLADIGLVAQAGEKTRLGTEGYIPPEGPGKPQADLYSLGKVLYEASTGTDRLDYPDLPPDVDKMAEREAFLQLNSIILKACDNDIRKRYQTATEISEDLTRLGVGRPVQTVRSKFLQNPVTIVAAVLLGALALALPLYWLRNPTTSSIPEKSVAVLPFDNLSDDKQNAYFAAGVQDEITSDLARIADLKVISRTSANLYKSGNPRNSREIGQQLGVAHLLEGSVQRIGNRLRVHAQLIDTRTDTHSWAQTYDRDVSDLFAIQSEIAQAIAGQLYAKISPAEQRAIERPPTADVTAFDLYTQAKDLSLRAPFTNSGQRDLLQAADLLNQALVRDPSFFQAYCLLTQTHDALYFFGYDRTAERLVLAEAALKAALRLQPGSGEAHLASAWNLYHGHLDYDAALAELEIARRTLPNNPRVFELTGNIRRRQGHWEESVQNFQRALELDPRNAGLLQNMAGSYEGLRRYAESATVLDRALTINPDDVDAKVARALIELDWKADTRPLHEAIDSIREKNPTLIHSVADRWFICALAERDAAVAASALAALGENTFGVDAVEFNRSFGDGLLARMTKDEAQALSAFAAARTQQEKIVQAQPNYGPALCVLGVINAGLERKEDALREGRRGVELLPVKKDAINGPLMIGYLAVIAAWVGDKDLACEQLAAAIRYPSSLSYGKLKLLPFWDPLRGDPRFEQIVASLAPNEN
jgi:TolB-like protein/lipopolysaccharide biosynthesis regulator YciM